MKSIFATINLLSLLFALALFTYSCTTEEIDTVTPTTEEALPVTNADRAGGSFDTKEIRTMLEEEYGDLGDISAEDELNRFVELLIEKQSSKTKSSENAQSTYMLVTAYTAIPYDSNGGGDIANRISQVDTLLVQSYPQVGIIRAKTRLASENNYYFGIALWHYAEILPNGQRINDDDDDDRDFDIICVGGNSIYDETLLNASITLYPDNTYQGSASVSCRRS